MWREILERAYNMLVHRVRKGLAELLELRIESEHLTVHFPVFFSFFIHPFIPFL
jgi:hypothetical protein